MNHTIFTPDGVTTTDYTSDEVTLFNADKAAKNAKDAAAYDYKTKIKADKDAGNAKLLSLGLTQDQVTALTGYDPAT